MMKRFIPLLLLAGVMIVAYYFIFSNEEWNDEGSLSKGFLSEEQKYLESLTEKEIQKQVFYTMPQEVLKPHLWGYCEEYYIKGETITLGTGVSEPIKLAFKNDGKRLTFDSVITPKDGNEYENSIRIIFPEEHVKQALEGVDTKQMVPSPKTQADNYYTGKLEVYF